jgi:hypothetical protein
MLMDTTTMLADLNLQPRLELRHSQRADARPGAARG